MKYKGGIPIASKGAIPSQMSQMNRIPQQGTIRSGLLSIQTHFSAPPETEMVSSDAELGDASLTSGELEEVSTKCLSFIEIPSLTYLL